MSKVSERRARAAETLLAEVEREGLFVGERRAGFSRLSLTRDGRCRASVTFTGMVFSVTTHGANARDALTKAYVFHKLKVDGFNDAGRY